MSSSLDKYKTSPVEFMKHWQEAAASGDLEDVPGWRLLGYTEDMVIRLEELAWEIYNQRRYDDAAAAFVFLIFLEMDNLNNWLGLGVSYQEGLKWDDAISTYRIALQMDPFLMPAYGYLAGCYGEIGELSLALDVIDAGIRQTEKDPENLTDWRRQFYIMRDVLIYR